MPAPDIHLEERNALQTTAIPTQATTAAIPAGATDEMCCLW